MDEKQDLTEDIKERIEHRDALLDIRGILKTEPGQRFFKYLFKNFEIGQVPAQGLEGSFLHDRIGFLRAGRSIFEIASEADFEMAAKLLAQIEKERYDKIYSELQV
jgi:hypothetical protein